MKVQLWVEFLQDYSFYNKGEKARIERLAALNLIRKGICRQLTNKDWKNGKRNS